MNLFGIANGALQGVNPNQVGMWVQATGTYTVTGAAGHRVADTVSTPVQVQVQAMSSGDLRLIENMNIQGVLRKIYLLGNVLGISRSDQRGGDVLQFEEVPGSGIKNWKVVTVVETWATWANVIVVLQ